MWRINNILLFITLVAVIVAGGLYLIEEISWMIDDFQRSQERAAARESRGLNAAEKTDESGELLRVQTVSYNGVNTYQLNDDLSFILIGQAGLKSPETIGDDEIIVTGSRQGLLSLPPSSRRADVVSSPESVDYVNNIAVRNAATGAERLLFSARAAIRYIQQIDDAGTSGIVVAFADRDSDGDGKIDGNDELSLRFFNFTSDQETSLAFEGRFQKFLPYRAGEPLYRFTTARDLDSNGRIDPDYEPYLVYEAPIDGGAAKPALSQAIIDAAQRIIDLPVPSGEASE